MKMSISEPSRSRFNKSINNLEGVAKDQLAVSKSLADLGENNAALNALEEAARIADKIDNPEAKAEAYLALADFYEKDGKSKQAIASYKKYSDAVRSNKKMEKKETAQRDELLKKQREIENLSSEVYTSREQERYEQLTVARQKLIIYGLIAIILIIATTSYFIYKNACGEQGGQSVTGAQISSESNESAFYFQCPEFSKSFYRAAG